MTERPILYSAPMVRANRADIKTQTRRTGGLAKINAEPDAWAVIFGGSDDGLGGWNFLNRDSGEIIGIRSRYGVGGDRLWVREAWSLSMDSAHTINGETTSYYILSYRAGGDRLVVYSGAAEVDPYAKVFDQRGGGWRPSIHMPRWASRDTLQVISVRPERLHCITKADALAEGIQVLPLQSADDPSAWYQSAPGIHQGRTAEDSFRQLWDSTSGNTLPWPMNPWVWRIEYRRISR